MGKKIFKSGYIRVEPNQEVDLDPVTLETEPRGVIHGTVRFTEGKACVATLFKIKLGESKSNVLIPVDFKYLDNWGQFLFPIVDTDSDTRYIVKIACLDSEDCQVDPVYGNCDEDD